MHHHRRHGRKRLLRSVPVSDDDITSLHVTLLKKQMPGCILSRAPLQSYSMACIQFESSVNNLKKNKELHIIALPSFSLPLTFLFSATSEIILS